MRVLIITNDGNHGGVANVAMSVVDHSPDIEFLVACGSDGPFLDELKRRGVNCIDARLGHRFPDRSTIKRLRRIIRDWKPDVVHSHHARAYLPGRVAAWLERVPHVSTPHTSILAELARRPEATTVTRWRMVLRERMTSWMDRRTIAISELNRQQLARQGARTNRLVTVANGVDLARFSPSTPKAADVGRSGEPVIGAIGRLNYPKGYDSLLRAYAQYRRNEAASAAHLAIYGDGPEEAALRALADNLGISDAVTFGGHRNDPEAILPTLDAVLFTSYYEGLPLALLEAMAAQRPIVAVDLPVFADILKDGAGLVVPRERLPEAIAEILGNPTKAAEMSQVARARVERDYSLQSAVDSIRGIYYQVAKQR